MFTFEEAADNGAGRGAGFGRHELGDSATAHFPQPANRLPGKFCRSLVLPKTVVTTREMGTRVDARPLLLVRSKNTIDTTLETQGYEGL